MRTKLIAAVFLATLMVLCACSAIYDAGADTDAASDEGSQDQITVTIKVGDSTEKRTIASGGTITLEDPLVEGKTFAGWFTDSKYTKQFDPAVPLTKNTTIYAKLMQEYSFYLLNTVSGEDCTMNGWHYATGYSPVDALCNALDAKNISHTFTNSKSSVTFSDKSISDWTASSWMTDGYYFGNQFAIWNYNEKDGWHLGNTFGRDSDTVYIISHEKYLDIDGPVATAYGIDNSEAWGDPADYDLIYDGVTGGYADAKMALAVWYKNTYSYGNPADYGISLKAGSTKYDDADDAATTWMGSFTNKYTAPAGVDCSGSGYGWAQLSPHDRNATPESVKFGLDAYPSVVKYVNGDQIKTVVHAIGDTKLLTLDIDSGYTFIGWYTTSDFSGSPVTEVSGDATLYAKIEAKPTKEYSFYLLNTVSGEDSTMNGWHYATGYSPVDALCNALDVKGISHSFTNSDESVFFDDKAISDWTASSWMTDGYYFGNQFAIWNYNEKDGWHLGNTFGQDSDTVYIISHEKYLDVDGPVATAYGIDNSEAWGDPADYDLVYDGVTGGYADAKMALIVWYRQTYTYGDLADYGMSLKAGSTKYDYADDAATAWLGSFTNKYTAPAGVDCSGSGYGWAQLSPRDLNAAPENVKFGLDAYPSVVEYIVSDGCTKTVVYPIGETARDLYVPGTESGYMFLGWYASADFSGSRISKITGDATLYAKIVKIPGKDQLIDSVTIKQFINGGEAVMITVEAGENAPAKALVVTYSAYIDVPEGRVLNPFITEAVEMTKEQTTAVFTPSKALKVESIAVTCWCKIGTETYTTPYAEAVAPTVSATIELEIDEGLTLTFDGKEIEDGVKVDYGYYTVAVSDGSSSKFMMNGTVIDGTTKLFYCGQELKVSKVDS